MRGRGCVDPVLLSRRRGQRRPSAVARMGCPPRLDPGHRFRPALVVPVLRLGQPCRLAGPLAGCLARRHRAVTRVSRVARVSRERLAAVQARPLLRPSHVVPLAKSQPRLLHDPGRTPKNTEERPNSEENISFEKKRPGRKSSFTPSGFDRFQNGRDTFVMTLCFSRHHDVEFV